MDKSKFVIGIQARSGSTRFPYKVLKSLDGSPMWRTVLYNAEKTKIETYILIPHNDEMLKDSVYECGCYDKRILGNEKKPLLRFIKLLNEHPKEYIIRITADCPLIGKEIILDVANFAEKKKAVFVYNELDGMDVQVAHVSLFEKEIYLDNEHVFNMEKIKEHGLYTKWEMHLSVDTKEQYDHIKFLMEDES
jgi:spore coat polysaccharide biosynthesis protein SpsF (cytidylyltransferase family)